MTVKLLEDTPAVLLLGKLCQDQGYFKHWTSGQKAQLIKKGRRIKCHTANYVPIVVPGLLTGSSISATPTSPTSLPQEAVIPTRHPASTRSESTSGIERLRWDPLRDLPEWLQEFTENLVDDSVPAHGDAPASSSRESSSEPRGTVVSGKHSIYSHFPKDRNCDICLKTKITRAPCRKRTGTVVPRAVNFGDLITADHKVLNEVCESRHKHRYAVVVQDLATQWIQSYPCQTKNISGNVKELAKVLGADEETQSHLWWQFPRIWQILWKPILESLYVNTTLIENKWDCWESGAQN